MRKRARVFISYAWEDGEDGEYRKKVRSFAERLRRDGVDARLDLWPEKPGLTIPEFMSRELRKAQKIVILCSPQYRTKVHAMEDGRSTGCGWEMMLVTSAVWSNQRKRDKLVPVLFRGRWAEAAPEFLIGLPRIDLTQEQQFEANYLKLLRLLTNQTEKAPPLGSVPTLTETPVEPLQLCSPLEQTPPQSKVKIASSAAVPRQLPAPPADFVGRKADIARLVSAVRERGAAISGVRGIAGVGKTALALFVANAVAADFPVGQIYLDLKGAQHRDDESRMPPLSVAEAMDHVIHSFYPAAKIPANDAERAGLYRTTLSGKRVLLLMDNALNQQQVEPLLPPAGCVMIVTSRTHFTVPGLFGYNLSELPREEACELLLKIAPRIGECADKIAKLCGYLPEALRATASLLANADNLSPIDLLQRMSSARRRLSLTGVELSLTTSSNLIEGSLRELWFQLGVFPGTFDECGAAAVWGTSNAQAKSVLTSLIRFSLVQFDSTHSRYYLHDLVRDFTLSRLSGSARALARFRHSIYYLDILAGSDFLYRRGASGVALGLGMFDSERLNIEAGQKWAEVHASTSKDAARVCVAYPDSGIAILPLRLRQKDYIAWLTSALKSVGHLSAPRPGRRRIFQSEVRLLTNLADARLARREYGPAAKLLERAIGRLDDLHIHRASIKQLISLGDILRASGRLKQALQAHNNAYSYAFDLAEVLPINLSDSRRGLVKEISTALYLDDVLAIHPREADESVKMLILGSLGEDYLSSDKLQKSISYFSHQLKLARETGDFRTQSLALSRLGTVQHTLGEHQRALEFHEQSRAIAEKLRDKESEADSLFNTAQTLVAMQDSASAVSTGEVALKLYEEIESIRADNVRIALRKWRDLKVIAS